MLAISSFYVASTGCSKKPATKGGPGAAAVLTCNAPDHYSLPVARIDQLAGNWCWAASGEIEMKAHGEDVAQCTQADHLFADQLVQAGQKSCCCNPDNASCQNHSTGACNNGGWPEFEHYGFNAQRTCRKPLNWDQLKEELACKKSPVPFSWLWTVNEFTSCTTGDGHMMVAYGYDERNNQKLVYVHDPTQSAASRQPSPMTYSEYAETTADHSHWDDYYDLKPVGGASK